MSSPAELAARIPELAGLTVQRQLADGPLSRKWLVEWQGSACVLRADKPAASLLALDRHGEAELLAALADAGWSPPPLFCLPEEGVLLIAYVEGRSWNSADYADPERLQQLGLMLARLHATPVAARDFGLAARVARYAEIIGGAAAGRRADELHALLVTTDAAQCLCHNDPTGGNVIGADTPALIDWEFAGRGAPGFDLAALIEAQKLSPQGIQALLAAYGAASGSVQPDLAVWRRIYLLTDLLWREALTAAGSAGPSAPADS